MIEDAKKTNNVQILNKEKSISDQKYVETKQELDHIKKELIKQQMLMQKEQQMKTYKTDILSKELEFLIKQQ